MCGGLARWLRNIGVDATYTPGIDDAALVQHALADARVVVSSDQRLFERRLLRDGVIRGVRLPVGLKLAKQVEHVFLALALTIGFPRCTVCNGELVSVRREEVADVVPARSLIWTQNFFRCAACGKICWEGTHWRRIRELREQLAHAAGNPLDPETVAKPPDQN